jgi:hypothetical protein
MKRITNRRARLLKALVWIGGTGVILFALYVGLLAFPELLMANQVQSGPVVVHYDGESDPLVEEWAAEVRRRLESGGFGDLNHPRKVALFRDPGLYGLLARLARVHPRAQGFGLSLVGTSSVSETRVEELGQQTGKNPPFGIWEGSVPPTIAHEIAHALLIDSIGRSGWLALPHWKQEGIPEYLANIGPIRADSTASLGSRIGVLLKDAVWEASRSWDRIHYEAGLMTEFLLEVRGIALEDLITDRRTGDQVLSEMLRWAETGSAEGSPGAS